MLKNVARFIFVCAFMLSAGLLARKEGGFEITPLDVAGLDKALVSAELWDLPQSKKKSKLMKKKLVLFIPGIKMKPNDYESIIGNLLHHGYAVVAVGTLLDGALTRQELRDTWVQGINAFLKDSGNMNVLKKKEYNPKSWYVIGHSLGGSTALQLCRLNENCKAAVNMDGALFGKDPELGCETPVLFLLKDPELPEPSEARLKVANLSKNDYVKMIEQFRANVKIFCETVNKKVADGCSIKTIPGTGHSSFSDLSLLKSTDARRQDVDMGTTADGAKVIEEVNKDIIEFLDRVSGLKSSAKKVKAKVKA